MDDGDYLEAQPGPINGEILEPQPFRRIVAAGWCLSVSGYLAGVAMGIVFLFLQPLDSEGVPVSRVVPVVFGFVLIALGSSGVSYMVCELVKDCRSGREVEAMTRLHVVTVSP